MSPVGKLIDVHAGALDGQPASEAHFSQVPSSDCVAVKTTTPSINAANISSILPNASLVDTLTDTKITSCTSTSSSADAAAAVQQKPTSSPMAPSEVSPNTAICDRPKVKSVSKKDCKNNRRLATAALAFQSNATVSVDD